MCTDDLSPTPSNAEATDTRRTLPIEHVRSLYARYGRRTAAVARFVVPLALLWVFVRWLFGLLAGAIRAAVPGAGRATPLGPATDGTEPATGGGFGVNDSWFDMPSGLGAAGPSPSLGFIDTSGFVEALLGPLNVVSHVVAVAAVLWLARRTWPKFRVRYVAAAATDAAHAQPGQDASSAAPVGSFSDRARRMVANLFQLDAERDAPGPGDELDAARAENERLSAELDDLRAELALLRDGGEATGLPDTGPGGPSHGEEPAA